jgi:hypothetical protein
MELNILEVVVFGHQMVAEFDHSTTRVKMKMLIGGLNQLGKVRVQADVTTQMQVHIS